ncbi:MAG: hypothetical protein DRJ61_18000 [Acidobacteria bacterium]|nr:MAG: hypothetical protein DRJ61_18000 [Acidobacteriota bacterium]
MNDSNCNNNHRAAKERFFSFVRVDPITEAWLWIGGITGAGYGGFWHEGKTVSAHRFSYELRYGEIPIGLFVCHKHEALGRHNVNPEHLFLGTSKDNMQDAARKGRTLKGADNPASKLTEDQVLIIASSTEIAASLVVDMGVSETIVSDIRRGYTWTHITGIKPAGKLSVKNRSGFIGVRWRDRGAAWTASIGSKKNGVYKSKHLGSFNTAEEAARAYDAEAINMRGPKATLNFPL